MTLETTHDGPRSVLVRAFQAWRRGTGIVPTTRAGAEVAVMVTLVGWRIGTLVQIVPSISEGIGHSPRPLLYVAVLVLVALESVGLCWYVIRHGGFESAPWATVDVALALLALAIEPLYIHPHDFIGTWTAWAPAFAINSVVVAAMGFRRRRWIALSAVLLALTYFLVSSPHTNGSTQVAAVRSNVLTYLVFGALARAMVDFVRRFGSAADQARAEAIESARIAELERHRRLLHDQAGLLRLLSESDIDPNLAEPLRRQALAESHRLRSFLNHEYTSQGRADDGSARLVDVVSEVAQDFTDLPIELMLDLGDDVQLQPPLVEPVRAAVATVLHNIRRHAIGASTIVIHADAREAEREWELSVRDDGCGFDLETTPKGYGLANVVADGLGRAGLDSLVTSAPGSGTSVVIRGQL